ncbi:MAG TPA: hypothetical protein DD670_02665 [Planctomycetaceae bacterium]|nr:hypothetical protein [Planctomycetaceae bacterium]
MDTMEQELISRIREAFGHVTLGRGVSLNMTEYYDSGGCVPEFAEKAKSDERHDWTKIPDSTLERFTVTFSFTDIDGFRFYLPAYMIYTIKNHRTSDSVISDFTIYAIDTEHPLFQDVGLLNVFSEAQLQCIISFLEYCLKNDGTCDGDVARVNLHKIRNAQNNKRRHEGRREN